MSFGFQPKLRSISDETDKFYAVSFELRSIAKFADQGFIVLDPVFDRDLSVFIFCIPDINVFNAGIDDRPFTHGTAGSMLYISSVRYLQANQIKIGIDHLLSRCTDDRIDF